MFAFLGEQCSEQARFENKSITSQSQATTEILMNSMTDPMDCIFPFSSFPDCPNNNKLFLVLVLCTEVVQINQSFVNSQINHQSVILCLFLAPDQSLFLQKLLYQNVNNSGGLNPKFPALRYGRCFPSLKLKWPSNIIPWACTRQTFRHSFLFYEGK